MKTLTIDLETATAVFEAWGSDLRANPEKFMTAKEAAAAELGELSRQRAAFFMGLLRQTQGVEA